MDFKEIVDLIVSNGIGVACIVYFMFRDYKFMGQLQNTMTAVRESLDIIEKLLLERSVKKDDTK